MGKVVILTLLISALILTGCGKASPNVPHAEDLCLSAWEDLYKLEYWPYEFPIPHDEYSGEYEPYPKYPEAAYETRYCRVFWANDSSEIRGMSLRLASGGCLENDVRVYRSVDTAKKAFANMQTPRFAFSPENIVGRLGAEWNIGAVGDESKTWRFRQKVLDEKRQDMVTEHEVEIYFRKSFVISSVRVVV